MNLPKQWNANDYVRTPHESHCSQDKHGAFQNGIVTIPRITLNLLEGENVPLQQINFPKESHFAFIIHQLQRVSIQNVPI